MIIDVKKDTTLLDLLMETFGNSSRTHVKKMIKYGCVTKNGALLRYPETALVAGEQVTFAKYQGRQRGKEKTPFQIIYEDQDLIAVIKPAGILTVGRTTEKTRSMFKMVQKYVEKHSRGKEDVFVVHRLDREVSGILLFAKSEKVKAILINRWPSVKKLYYALVEHIPAKDQATIESYLAEDKEDPKHRVRSVECPTKDHPYKAVTHYHILEKFKDKALLEVELETGFKNQIRVHLSEIGCPIVGDRRYGADDSYIRQIRLHAFSLTLKHPITHERLSLEVSMPKTFLKVNDEDENY